MTINEKCDNAIIEISKGNIDALSVIYRTYGKMVFSVGYQIVNNVSDAEDVLQEVMLNVVKYAHTYRQGTNPNITQIRKDGVIINEYTYDSLGQLTCEEDAVADKTYIYYYDKSGNITQKDSYPFAEGETMGDYISYIAPQRQTVATYTYGNGVYDDALIPAAALCFITVFDTN